MKLNLGGRLLLFLLLLLLLPSPSPAAAVGDWWNDSWGYRLPLLVDVGAYERYDKPVELQVNFTDLLNDLGQNGTLDLDSLRVIEVNGSGEVVSATVPFQFDADDDFKATTKASGTIIFIMEGTTPANSTRYFHIYFDLTGSSFTPPSITPQVVLTDSVTDEGLDSFKIETAIGDYYYQKVSGGFSSLVDVDDNDWISYHPTGGSAGNYRGIPNLVYPEGYFHPGTTSLTTTLVSTGPLKIKLDSTTSDNNWDVTWEFYPHYAKMTVLKINKNHWFLYEGTPGGSLDLGSDFVVRSDGTQNLVDDSWTGDIADEEWLYFGDPNVGRALFLAHHEDDTGIDSYWQLANNMTVFGFGRDGLTSYLDLVPAHFTIGLMDDTGFATASKNIYSAYKDLTVTPATAEMRPAVAPTITGDPADQTVEVGQPATFSVVAAGTEPLSYQWQRDGVDIPGATGASYTTPATTTADDGVAFRCVVTNTVDSVVSEAAILTVTEAPTITGDPADQTVEEGQTATFSVVAAGTEPLSYQWQRDGVDIPGATGASYTTPAVTTADNGAAFRCVVTNTVDSVVSEAAILTVTEARAAPSFKVWLPVIVRQP